MKRLVCVSLTMVIVATGQTICCADLTDGLIAHFSFDNGSGLVLDEKTGLTSVGELIGFEDDDSQWVEGQVGGALEFDGIDDYVIVPEYSLVETESHRPVSAD